MINWRSKIYTDLKNLPRNLSSLHTLYLLGVFLHAISIVWRVQVYQYTITVVDFFYFENGGAGARWETTRKYQKRINKAFDYPLNNNDKFKAVYISIVIISHTYAVFIWFILIIIVFFLCYLYLSLPQFLWHWKYTEADPIPYMRLTFRIKFVLFYYTIASTTIISYYHFFGIIWFCFHRCL